MKETKTEKIIEITNQFEQLLKNGLEYLSKSSEQEMSQKSSPEKWSKKEILGHLIDSGIINIQRFTEVQFENKPYRIKQLKQNELVKANGYQNAKTSEITDFWVSVNNRILKLIKQQTEKTLNYKIELDKNNTSDFKFLIKDYVDHLKHHLNQITE